MIPGGPEGATKSRASARANFNRCPMPAALALLSEKADGVGAQIGAEVWGARAACAPSHAPRRGCASRLHVVIEPAHKAEAAAGQARRTAKRRNAASMHSVPSRTSDRRGGFAAPAGHHHDAGPERFVDRRLRLDRPIAAAMERIAGAIEAQRHVVVRNVQVERDHRDSTSTLGRRRCVVEELIADGVFDAKAAYLECVIAESRTLASTANV